MKHARSTSAGLVLCLGLVEGAAAGELRGRILAEDKPVSGATVAALPFESPFDEARREARREDAGKPLGTATTRPDGTFVLTLSPPPGPASVALVRLKVTGGGLAPALLEPVFDTNETAIAGDVTLVKATTLAGKVVDGRAGPVVGATVTLFPGGGASFVGRVDGSPIPVTTTTGADGTFRFAEAAARGNRLRVEAPGFGVAEVTGAQGGALRRAIALSLGRALTGQVVRDDRRTPAAGALVRFEGRGGTSRWHEARPDGAFLVDGLPAEPGVLVADGGDKGRGTVTVEAGANKATVVLAPTASLKGRVVDAASGAPLARIKVVARSESALFVARSGPDGRYEIRGLPARAYHLVADDPAYVPWSREAVRVAPGGTDAQDVILTRAASLSGRVVDERGLPIEGASGRLTAAGEGGRRAFMAMIRGDAAFRSARDGSFTSTRLAPGAGQTLTVQHPDYEPRTIGGVSLHPSAPARVNVVLRSGLSARGIVKDERGQPIPGAEVELMREMRFQSRGGQAQFSFVGGPGTRPRKETGADGRFEFKGLATGDYTLTVTKRGYGRERVDPVKIADGRASEPIEVVVRPGATISGYVRDKAGNGAPGYRVSARSAGAGARGPMGAGPFGGPSTEEPTGPDGAFVIEGVGAGETYELQVFGESGLGPRKAGISAPADGVELVVDGRGRIRGTALDADTSRALRDFEVSYEPSREGGMVFRFAGPRGRGRGAGEPAAFHADDGTFTLDDVPAGKWDVQVRSSGYQSARLGGVLVEEGATVEGVDVRLSRGGVISGRVTDARSAKPVRDAAVRAELSGGGGPRMRFGPDGGGQEASSDADGQFQIAGLTAGSYTVTATHPEWSEATEKVDLKEAVASLDLKMTTGAAVGGTVIGAGQRPVAGASVALSAGGGGMTGPFDSGDQSSITDAAGRFRFERLTAGRYSLIASLRGQSSSSAEVVMQQGDPGRDVTLTLGAGATLKGFVTGLPEAQRAAVNVNASGPEDFFASTRTGADGAFEFSGVPAGAINLGARAGDFASGSRSASAQVVVAEGQLEATADIVFEPGFRLDGHVSRGGKPVTDALVNAFPEGGGRSQGASGRSDESGAFALEGLQAGTYNVSAMSMGGGAALRKTVSVNADTSVDLEAPPARLAGTIVEQGSGRPLADAAVRIEDQGRGFMGMSATSSDSNGRFALEDLEPKVYTVGVQKPAYQTETKSLTAADPSGDLVIELKRGEGIGVVAKDGIYGVPLHSLSVRVLDSGGVPVYTGGVSLDSEGRGEIPSLRAGTYQLRADSQGYAPVNVPQVAVPAPSISLILTPGGTLEIHAGPETLALANSSARILYPSGAVYFPFLFSPDGLIRLSNPIRRLENVAPGSYVLAVEGGGRKPFEIREGGSTVAALP
jgi:protocatechuate 3,4-dioxygenase beta subunit